MGVTNCSYEIESNIFNMMMLWGGVEMLHICRKMLTSYKVLVVIVPGWCALFYINMPSEKRGAYPTTACVVFDGKFIMVALLQYR